MLFRRLVLFCLLIGSVAYAKPGSTSKKKCVRALTIADRSTRPGGSGSRYDDRDNKNAFGAAYLDSEDATSAHYMDDDNNRPNEAP